MSSEYVILLHGMGRSKLAMKKLERYLTRKNYKVINIDYPSTKLSIEELSNEYIPNMLSKYKQDSISKLHIVTHSLGGILVRNYLQTNQLPTGSRIVMLAPPNKGSEVADFLKNNPFYKYSTGKAGQELTTNKESLPNTLEPISYEVGIIAGTKNIEPWFSLLFNGQHDGKVSVESTKLKEMTDFIALPYTHTFIMNAKEVHNQVEFFLKNGKFEK